MMGSREGIAERRLRPLWDAIDTRQYKTALKLATSLQAKHPDSSYLIALKGLVLERTGKSGEALLLCQQARDSGPVDELTLNTLQTVYNRLHQLHEATACYEYACSKIPNNVDLLMALFKCYVRQYVYVKQQQTAMKLYKQIGEERFLLWAVCSILMQVGSDNGSGSKLIALAEGLLKKRVETQGLHDLEALMLYINVLQQQEKYESALEVLSGKLGGLFSIQIDRLRLQGELLMSTRQYDQAAEVFEEILKISSDDWEVFLSYLDASLGGVEQNAWKSSALEKDLQENEVDKRLDKVMTLVEELQGMDVQELRRGPFLAVVEIAKKRLTLKKKAAEGKQLEEQSALVSSILAYFERFGHLSSFSSDMSTFVEYIDEDHKFKLATVLHKASTRIIHGSPVKQLRCRVSAFQVEEQLRTMLRLSDKDLISHAAEIVKLYLESLELSVDLDAQESMHGEELLVLVANLLIEVFRRSQRLGYLLEAVLVLEFGLYARRFSSQYKLMLIDLYSMLSAVAPALDWYKTLDIKFILVETLSHFMLPGMLSSTRWSDLQSLLKDSLKFYDNHGTESADLTILAYQHCTYSKVLEFVKFKEKLERSHQHLVFRIEAAILAIKQKADKLEEVEFCLADLDFGKKTVEWSSEELLQFLSFNEDLQTRPWWSPVPDRCYLTGSLRSVGGERSWHHVETEDERIIRENRWRSAVRRRCLIPRMLNLLLEIVKEIGTGQRSGSPRVEFIVLLEEFLKTLNLQLDNIESWISDASSPGKLVERLQDLGVSSVEMMTVTVFWASYQLTSNLLDNRLIVVSLLVQVMENIIDELMNLSTMDLSVEGDQRSTLKVVTPGTALYDLVGLTSESFAFLGLYLQACAKRLQPVPKKKKKGAGFVEPSDIPVARHLPASLESIRIASVRSLEKLKTCITDYLSGPVEQEVDALMILLRQDSEIQGACPGTVLGVLKGGVVIASKLATRTPKAKQSWVAAAYVRNMVSSQRATLDGIQGLCTLRLKVLKSLKF